MVRTAAVLTLLVCVTVASAQETKKKDFLKHLKIGDPAPAYTDLKGVDGQKHSLSDLKDKDVVVLVIACNHCPVVQAYLDRIKKFAKEHAGPASKVALVAISVNDVEQDPADSFEEMVKLAKEAELPFAYLYDPSQQIAKDLGASRTPEFFVFDKDRKLVYHGALDDSMRESKVKVNYLEPAVKAALKGEKVETPQTKPDGCPILFIENRKPKSDDKK
jgi:peroxiredoxin